MIVTEFEKQVLEDVIKMKKIKSVEDLDKRWSEPYEGSIAEWFIKNDFIPSHWYRLLRVYIRNK